MVQKPIKKRYETPKLKEHGVVRELTQSGSGRRRGPGRGRGRGRGRGKGKHKGW